MKFKTFTKILIAALFIGLSLLLYPTFSNYWNLKHTTRVVNEYTSQLDEVDDEGHEEIWKSAIDYNEALLLRENPFVLSDELRARYYEELKLTESGLMGYVDIPSIGVSLPIYHGTSDSVLQVGIGHLDWSSLPTGGESTHCVVSGHRGLPSAKLFTDLNRLREGDTFTLNILNEVLTYEVDQIRTVLPNEVDGLSILEGCDFCTLVTCTPYGINTHRLLVRGHRIATAEAGATVISEAVLVDQLIVAFDLGFPLVMILFLTVMLKRPKKKKSEDMAKEELL